MVEKFSEIKEENGLTLPHNYDIYLEILTGNGTVSYTWNLELNTFSFNQVLGADEFRVEGN